ncbi:MAG: GatB/YqeY domain-containing protein [Anaerolineae bacterium]
MDDPRVRLQADLKEAMRAKDRQRITVLRMALNAIKQEEIDKRVTLSAEDATAILMREAKKRYESIQEAAKAGRTDIAEAEQQELNILEAYLPKQMTESEIAELVKEVIAEVGASSPKDMGNVMRVLMPRVKGQADGGLVNRIVREQLSG